jgi:hypothetical protein
LGITEGTGERTLSQGHCEIFLSPDCF